MIWDWQIWREKIGQRVKGQRWVHVVGTADTAKDLALHYGLEGERAYLAGLCHDYARDMPPHELLDRARDWAVTLDYWERKIPVILHGPVGAELVRRDLGVQDEEILRAIAIHTTGHKEMTPLEKILFLADKIEPNRNYPGVEEIRRLALIDLDQALIHSLELSLSYVLSKKMLIHPRTVEARNSLLLLAREP